MKRWPLRWKIALYAAGLGVIATIAGAATTWTLMHYAEMRAFDRRLAEEANEALRVFSAPDSPPLRVSDHVAAVWTDRGELRYRAPNVQSLVLEDGRPDLHTRKIDGQKFRVGEFRAYGLRARLAANLADISAIGRDIIFGMFGAIPTVLAVVLLGGRWVAGQALGPVDAIQQAAAQISPKHLDQRLPVPATNDEIASLISVLNSTFDRLQRSFEQSARFSADASHHLKTPIAVLRAGIEEILRDPDTPAKQQARADALLHQTHQLTSIAENLLLLARADAGRLELKFVEFDLREVLDGAVDDLRALAEPNRISIDARLPNSLPVRADRFAVALITQNLIDNAVKFNRSGGRIQLQTDCNGDYATLSIGNNGKEIPHDRVEHIFERFYRARGDQQTPGHGLGLSIARELARAHGGDLVLAQRERDWTEFRLRLPRVQMDNWQSKIANRPS
jgi:Signal transduction histidine kinase